MEALFFKIANMSITASWLVLAVIAVRLIFKKTPKWILCLLWGLVAVRLICPFSIESSLSVIPNAEPLSQDVVYTTEQVNQARGDILDSEGNIVVERHPPAARGEILDFDGNVVVEKDNGVASYPEKAQTQSWMYFLSRIWLIGICGMLIYTLVSYFLLKRKVATAIPVRKGIKQSEFVDSPFVLGIIRPTIYLPFGMEEADMAYVIAHERAHIRRRDHWWKPLGFLLLSIYWFNPVMWVAYILLCRDIEAACDEKVIKDMEKDERRAYSTALLNCSIHRRRIAACPLAFGETGVKARVKSVMNYKKPAFWVILIALIVCIVVAVCFLTNPKSEEEPDNGYDLIEAVTSQDKYKILDQESTKVNLVIEKDKLPEDCFTLKGYTFEKKEVIPYQTYADNILYLKHVGIDEERSEYLRFTFAFQTDTLEKENLLLPYHVDIEGNGFVCNVEVNRGEVWDNQKTYENAAYFEPVMNGEGFCVLVKKAVCESAGHHIAFMLNDMNRLTYEVREEVSPVTISLENVRPTGATILFHQNMDLIDGALLCNYEYFLQQQVNGKWEDLPRIADVPFPDQTYDIATLHHNGVNWEQLYGRLPVGFYRLGKVIPITSGDNPEYATVYAEFSIDHVYTWFDLYSTDINDHSPKDNLVELFGMERVTLSYNSAENTIYQINSEGREPIITCDLIFRNVFLTDLTGDGISEVCATIQNDSTTQVQVYDASEKKLYELPVESNGYKLTKKADRLCVYRNDEYGNPLGYWQLTLQPGKGIVLADLDPEVEALKSKLVCVDVNTRKRICLSSGQQLNQIMTLLRNLRNTVKPASEDDLAQAQTDEFNTTFIDINYEVGKKTICISKDFNVIWVYGSEEGYLISDSEPLRQYIHSIMDGVRGKETSGEPFATMDAPWDWCTNVDASAVQSAQLHVCLSTYSSGNTSGSTSTNGVISYQTLQELIGILNQIPSGAITPGNMLSKQSYHRFFINQDMQNTAISIVDGVNNLGVVLKYRNGTVTMLLTDEMEKVTDEDPSYLEPTQLWTVQDEKLLAFMQSLSEAPPVITYFVGAEYEWQEPILFSSGNFSLTLRLVDGWESEPVSNPTNSGIRCRPEGITEGWIYFSYWPEEYKPTEENRFINEGIFYDWKSYTSYPADANANGSFSTFGQIWSYERYDLEEGDYVVINDGADSWFAKYKDCIQDIMTLSNITVE